MNEIARWIALQEPAFAVPLKGVAGRMAKDFGLSASEAGQLLEEGIRTGAIALQDADTGAIWLPSPQAMATQIDWATGWLVLGGLPMKMLAVHWPDVEQIARMRTPGAKIEGRAIDMPAGPPPDDARRLARPECSEAALSAWFVLRERTWPKEAASPNEAEDMAAAKRYFDSVPSRDEFRRIRQSKTTDKWRKPGPRVRR